jgi:hypothetical protein
VLCRSGGQQNKGEATSCTEAGLTEGQPGLTASPSLMHNKSKPKMVKPKKPEIGVLITIESKGRKHRREKPKPNEKLPAKSQRQNNVNGASRSKNSKRPKLLLEISSIMRIDNGVTLTNQCRFLHMDHQCLCHGNLFLLCIIFVLHGIIIHICRLLVIFVKIILLIGSR